MEVPYPFQESSLMPILSVEMHTTGEPTRIIYRGFPELSGTLLEQRTQAKRDHDNIRTRLMHEPRGHFDMYGALLRPDTEYTNSGDAHMGVLFMTNDGFSTMCGHATIALGRFLLDTQDLRIFPKRNELVHNSITNTIKLNLHAPCGLIRVTVPTTADGSKADPSRSVSFVSVPSFTTGIDIVVPIAPSQKWPGLGKRENVTVDFSYGGAFYCIVSASELGFPQGLRGVDLEATNKATRLLKAAVNANPDLKPFFFHPDHDDLGFLYSIMIVDEVREVATDLKISGSETGLCYFADQQIDRSPTGGGVAARIALAYSKGKLSKEQVWTYNSLVSNACNGQGSFSGCVVEELGDIEVEGVHRKMVRVKVEGFAYYTGFHNFVVEKTDTLRDGFSFNRLAA